MKYIAHHLQTRLDLVKKIKLKISKRLAKQCGEMFAVVHHELAIGKLAIQRQAKYSLQHDDVFIFSAQFVLKWHNSRTYGGFR